MVYFDFDITLKEKYRKAAVCPLCAAYGEKIIGPRQVSITIYQFIPFGTYDELICQCPSCMQEFLIDESFSKSLVPSWRARLIANLSWLFLVIPFFNILWIIFALKTLPVTSNRYRLWPKIAMIPALPISFIFVVIAFVLLTA